MNTNTPFGRSVKIRLIEKNMTHKELASEIGIRKTYLSQILSGYRPAKKHVEKICAILGLEPPTSKAHLKGS